MMASFPRALLRALLRLFPSHIRRAKGRQIEALYRNMWAEMTHRGPASSMGFTTRMAGDLIGNALRAWAATALGRGPARDPRERHPSSGCGAMVGELKVALRRLRKTPGFTAVAILTLALGITANTVVFALIQGVYLKPLPFPEPDRLVYLQESDGQMNLSTSHQAFEYFKRQAVSFEELEAYSRFSAVLRESENPIRLTGARISAQLLPTLGAQPILGRGFLSPEDEPGAGAVVILSHAAWQNHFGGRPDIIGLSIRLGSLPHTVVGVMPPDFRFPSEGTQFWVTLTGVVRQPTYRSLSMVGRLAPGVSKEAAAQEVMAVGRRLEEENDPAKGGEFTYLHPLKDRLVGTGFQAWFTALAVAVGCLLLIAGANLTNLLLARASTRTSELVVREALGASGIRMLLTNVAEPMILSLASGLVGILGAAWALETILTLAPTAIPRSAEIGLNPWVVLFALGISGGAGFLIGLISLTRSRGGVVSPGIHSGTRVSRGRRLQSLFTVAQVALTFALLAGVSLMGRTVANLQAVDVGFDPSDALVVNLGLSGQNYSDPVQRLILHDQVIERALELPWVTAAGYTSFLPLTGGWNDLRARVEGNDLPYEELPIFEYDVATPGFFDAMGIALRQGRFLDEGDRKDALLVAVVNETAARLHFPEGEPLGRRFSVGSGEEPTWLTVVGVVEDVKHHSLREAATPKFYVPFTQFSEPWPYGLNLVVRTDGVEPQAAAGQLRAMIRGMATGNPLVEISLLRARVDQRLEVPRFNVLLLGIFTLGALGLASLGVYGLVAFGVVERRKEIGLRLALGADGWRVQREILWRGLRLTLVGILLGVPLALGMGRVMASTLFGVAPSDPRVFALVTLLLAGVSTTACLLPSRRASRIDPMVSLRLD
jgi:putative ABC transport system permease protein